MEAEKLNEQGAFENLLRESGKQIKDREMYNVFHLHIKETSSGSRQSVIDGWKQIIVDNLIVIDRHEDVSKTIAETVINNYSKNGKEKPLKENNETEIL